MDIGIYDIDSTDLSIKERFEIYKEVGFNYVGFYFDNDYLKEGETYLDLINASKEVGLKLSQLHLDYKKSNMLSLNEDNEFINYVEMKVDEAINYKIRDLVIHASKGNEPPLISSYTLKRLKKISKKLLKYNVRLCFENVRNNTNLEIVMKEGIDNMCICYDSGHAHCYSDEIEFLNKYKDLIVTTHIHDNFKEDSHDIVGRGNIDWYKIVNALNKTKREIDYLECFPPRGKVLNKSEFKDFILEVYKGYDINF